MSDLITRLLPPYTFSISPTLADKHEGAWWFPAWRIIHRIGRKVDNAYFWLAHRSFDRYHVVRTDLPPGYYDADERMFRACFALLGQFVERELGAPDPEYPEASYRGYRLHSIDGGEEQAIDLWIWYKQDLPAMEEDERTDYRAFSREHGHDWIENQKTTKLDALMRIRRCLWT